MAPTGKPPHGADPLAAPQPAEPADAARTRRIAAPPGAAPGAAPEAPAARPLAAESPAAQDAFAATIAPTSLPPATATAPARAEHDAFAPTIAPLATPGGRGLPSFLPRLGSDLDRTLDGPLGAASIPPLPEVDPRLYHTDAELARGGMGRISAATDARLGRKVALKELLEPAGEHLVRFHREALITARLQHPSIVPVYEAGRWPTGEPFFAMKLVSGRPLDRVIAETKTLIERIALLPRIVAATDAIAYAHSLRIIHRDLKPGNILVGDFGETVVIDWGLAKDLDADVEEPVAEATVRARKPSLGGDPARAAPPRRPRAQSSIAPAGPSTLTVVGAVMGTPAYMSPEQARGLAIDERSDVFALGAMLYHTLAGRPPYDAKTATEVITAAADGQVVPLRHRDPDIPPELVAIVERAMAPHVERRYPSARELAEELRRFMTGQLVGAHRYTPWQRMRRFVQRHRAAVTISVVAALAFVVGGTFAVRRIVTERDRAEEQRSLALTRKTAAESLVDFMLSDLRRRLAAIGRADLLTGMGTEVRRYYDQLAASPQLMAAEDVDRMAKALAIIAQAEGQAGNLDTALTTWHEAKEHLSRSLTRTPDGPSAFSRRRTIARTEVEIGHLLQQRGKLDDAGNRYREALRLFGALLEESPTDRDALLFSATAHDRLADYLRNSGKVDESLDEYMLAKQKRERVVAQRRGKNDREAVYELSTSHARLGTVHDARGDSASALAEYRAAARQRHSLLEAEPDNVEWQAGMVHVQSEIGSLYRDLGDLTSSIATYQEALPLTEQLIRRDPSNTTWKRDRGNLLADFGFTLLAAGSYQDALTRFEQAIDNHSELLAIDPENTAWKSDASRYSTRAGDALQYLGRTDLARARFEEALALRAALAARDPKNVPWKRQLAWAHAKLAVFHTVAGNPAEASAAHEQALRLRQELVANSKSHAGLRDELASTQAAFGKLLITREPARAEALLRSSEELARALSAADPNDNSFKETLTSALAAAAELARARGDRTGLRAKLVEALAVAEQALARAGQSASWPGLTADLHSRLGELDAQEGKRDESVAHFRQARTLLERLATTGRLPAHRKGLLARVRAQTPGFSPPP